MARGGYRPGAGRPRGTKNGTGKQAAEEVVMTPPVNTEYRFKNGLDFLIFVMNDTTCSTVQRIDAAKAIAPFLNVKKGALGKKEQQGEAAAKVGTGKYAPSAPPRMASVHQLPVKEIPDR
jgi:phage terminase small subunit